MQLLTSTECAALLRVHPKHLYRLLRRGLPGHRVGGGHWRFDRDEVLAWMRTRSPRVAPSDDRVEAELALHGAMLRAGTNRIVLARVGPRLVAHALAPDAPRSADALVELEAPLDLLPCQVRVTPVAPIAGNLFVAGCAPMLGMVLDRLDRERPAGRHHLVATNSMEALDMLDARLVHVAGIHLEESGTDHLALLRKRFPAEPLRVVRCVRWHTGLVLRPGARRRRLVDLVDTRTRWVLRESGAGTRNVLERALHRVGARMSDLRRACVAHDHAGVARAIALGAADVGVAVESVARQLGLHFVPLTEEGFDLVARADDPDVGATLDAIDDPGLRREVAASGPYDTSTMGHPWS
jgi:excisionase family DNA binding protein